MKHTPDRREQLGSFLNEHALSGTMVEVGGAFGGFAEQVLNWWHGREYYIVDLWRTQDPTVYREITNSTVPFRQWLNQCMDLCERESRLNLICADSVCAAKLFPHESLSCVYVDANHEKTHVLSDLRAWWPKVEPYGLMCGHDCYNSKEGGHYCEVLDAVNEWSQEIGRTVAITPCTSWWVRKMP